MGSSVLCMDIGGNALIVNGSYVSMGGSDPCEVIEVCEGWKFMGMRSVRAWGSVFLVEEMGNGRLCD